MKKNHIRRGKEDLRRVGNVDLLFFVLLFMSLHVIHHWEYSLFRKILQITSPLIDSVGGLNEFIVFKFFVVIIITLTIGKNLERPFTLVKKSLGSRKLSCQNLETRSADQDPPWSCND